MINTTNTLPQGASLDPGIHPSGIMDHNNITNNATNFLNNLNNSPLSSNNTNPCPQIHNSPLPTSVDAPLNQQTTLPDNCHIATQNIRGGLSHLSKQIAILSLLNNPPPSTTRIDIFGIAHTGLTTKQAKHAFTYDIFSNYKPYFSSATDNHLHSGVGLLLHNSFAIYVQKTGSLPGRVIYVDLYTKGKSKLRIIQVYIPPFNTDNKDSVIKITNSWPRL